MVMYGPPSNSPFSELEGCVWTNKSVHDSRPTFIQPIVTIQTVGDTELAAITYEGPVVQARESYSLVCRGLQGLERETANMPCPSKMTKPSISNAFPSGPLIECDFFWGKFPEWPASDSLVVV